MSGVAVCPEPRVPLPQVEGPRLHPFPTRHGNDPNIEFLEHLGSGLTAHVFKARVDGQIFALKIFKWEEVDRSWGRVLEKYQDKIDLSVHTAHLLPFYSECRAYARMKELNKEHLAARCYGYFFLNAAQEQEVQDKLGPFDWTTEEESSHTCERPLNNSPLPVLVKDFIPGKVCFERKDARRMLRNLHALHRCGIMVMDIKDDAYINGILVDFSQARTIPHVRFNPELGFDPYKEGQEATWADLGNLQEVFDEWNDEPENTPKIRIPVAPNYGRLATLRSKDEDLGRFNYKFFDPTKFDWRRSCQRASGERQTRSAGKPTGVVKRRGKAHKSVREETPGKKTRRRRPR